MGPKVPKTKMGPKVTKINMGPKVTKTKMGPNWTGNDDFGLKLGPNESNRVPALF